MKLNHVILLKNDYKTKDQFLIFFCSQVLLLMAQKRLSKPILFTFRTVISVFLATYLY